MKNGSFQKFENYHKNIYRVTSPRLATFELTVRNTLKILGEKKDGQVLDIGCGCGEIDILIAQNTNFNITGCDISETALKNAQSNIEKAGLGNRIKVEEGNVFNLKYPDNFFDIILSFGYVSAATYPEATQEVARVLKPGGFLVCDFINCLSLYKIFVSLKRVMEKKPLYYLTLSGIRRQFQKEGLVFVGQRLFNTFPPIEGLSPNFFLGFENTVGKVFKNFLARVRLVCFQKLDR